MNLTKKNGSLIMEMIQSKNVEASKLDSYVSEIVKNGISLAKAYAAKYPESKKSVDVMIAHVDAIKKLEYKKAQKLWHDFDAPELAPDKVGLDLKKEENESVSDPLHTIVHPLLVYLSGQQYLKSKSMDDLKSMKGEMAEGIEQAKALVGRLGK
jgi:hypothetical protein